jgi:serine/threonine protein kinase
MTPEADLAGRTLAHYRLVERIGPGGMGVVYRAEDTHLDLIVAIKVLPADAAADPERRRRFVQKAKAASALNHPNIVHVYDIGSADGIDFIAMEYVSGTTLERLVVRRGLPLGDVLKCAAQVAGALAAAHAAHQRQGGTRYPDLAARMGLPHALRLVAHPDRRRRVLRALLQSPPAPHEPGPAHSLDPVSRGYSVNNLFDIHS